MSIHHTKTDLFKQREQDDSTCNKCGKCCELTTTLPSGRKIWLGLYCKYQNKDGTCSIYENRFELAPWCRPIRYAIECNNVPGNCAYIQGLEDYKEPATNETLKGICLRNIIHGIPVEGISKSDWERVKIELSF